MRLSDLKKLTKSLIEKYPEYAEELEDFFQLAVDEVEDGGSEQHECNLAYNSMMDLLEDDDPDDPSQDLRKEEEYNWTQEEIRKEIERGND